jgi:hypothetical protein
MKQYVPIGSLADITPASQRRQSEIKERSNPYLPGDARRTSGYNSGFFDYP